MATVAHKISSASTSNAGSYGSGAFTPVAGDLLVVMVLASGTVDSSSAVLSDTQNLGWTKVAATTKNGGADVMLLFVANTKAAASSETITFTCTTGDNATGCIILVAGVSGIYRTGLSGVARQFKVNPNQSGGAAPTATFDAAALTGNPTIGFAADGTGTSSNALTPPTNWTEAGSNGNTSADGERSYTTPANDAEYAYRNSGFTGTTITWGASSAQPWGVIIVELDTTAAPLNLGALNAAAANATPTCDVSGLPAPPAPKLVQRVQFGNQMYGDAILSNSYTLRMPNKVRENNTVVIFADFDINTNPSVVVDGITDDGGNTWSTTRVDGASTSGVLRSDCFVLLRANNAGARQFTVHFSANLRCAHFLILEYCNVGAVGVHSSAANGRSGNTISAPAISPAAGSLLLQYAYDHDNMMGNVAAPVTAWTAGSGWNLESAVYPGGTSTSYQNGIANASPFALQVGVAGGGSVTPSMTCASTGSDAFATIAIELTYQAIGYEAPTDRVYCKRVTWITNGYANLSVLSEPLPCEPGSTLLVLDCYGCVQAASGDSLNGAASWDLLLAGEDPADRVSVSCLKTTGHTFGPTMVINIANSVPGSNTQTTFMILELTGADPDTPVVLPITVQGRTGVPVGPATSGPNPTVTPHNVNGVMVLAAPIGEGPIDGSPTPTGNEFLSMNYANQTDQDKFDNSDGYAIFNYFQDLSTQYWYWHHLNTGLTDINTVAVEVSRATTQVNLGTLDAAAGTATTSADMLMRWAVPTAAAAAAATVAADLPSRFVLPAGAAAAQSIVSALVAAQQRYGLDAAAALGTVTAPLGARQIIDLTAALAKATPAADHIDIALPGLDLGAALARATVTTGLLVRVPLGSSATAAASLVTNNLLLSTPLLPAGASALATPSALLAYRWAWALGTAAAQSYAEPILLQLTGLFDLALASVQATGTVSALLGYRFALAGSALAAATPVNTLLVGTPLLAGPAAPLMTPAAALRAYLAFSGSAAAASLDTLSELRQRWGWAIAAALAQATVTANFQIQGVFDLTLAMLATRATVNAELTYRDVRLAVAAALAQSQVSGGVIGIRDARLLVDAAQAQATVWDDLTFRDARLVAAAAMAAAMVNMDLTMLSHTPEGLIYHKAPIGASLPVAAPGTSLLPAAAGGIIKVRRN